MATLAHAVPPAGYVPTTKEDQATAKFLFSLLRRIPNDNRFETFARVGVAVHSWSKGSLAGVYCFYNWCLQSPCHTDRGFLSLWQNPGSFAIDVLSAMGQTPVHPLADMPTSPTIH